MIKNSQIPMSFIISLKQLFLRKKKLREDRDTYSKRRTYHTGNIGSATSSHPANCQISTSQSFSRRLDSVRVAKSRLAAHMWLFNL